MRILYYSPHPTLSLRDKAGYATHMRSMMAAFRQLGHDLYPHIMGGGDSDSSDVAQSTPHTVFKKAGRYVIPKIVWSSLKDYRLVQIDRRYKYNLSDIINSFKPDLIYERANYLQTSGIEVARDHGIFHILEINSPLVEERTVLGERTLFYKKARSIERWQLKNTNICVVVSSALEKYFRKMYNIDDIEYMITPNAVNVDDVRVDNEKKRSIIDKYKLHGNITIGFVGSFFKWHGLDILIKSFKIVSTSRDNIRLLIVGDGSIMHMLKKMVEDLGLSGKVNFTGSVDHREVYTYIDCMDIAVLPNSHWYGSPVKLFEYGALGKAIIAPDNAPVRDVMVDGIDGLLVSPSVSSLTDKIETLLNNKELRSKIGNSFRSKVFNNYTWAKNAERILEKYIYDNKPVKL